MICITQSICNLKLQMHSNTFPFPQSAGRTISFIWERGTCFERTRCNEEEYRRLFIIFPDIWCFRSDSSSERRKWCQCKRIRWDVRSTNEYAQIGVIKLSICKRHDYINRTHPSLLSVIHQVRLHLPLFRSIVTVSTVIELLSVMGATFSYRYWSRQPPIFVFLPRRHRFYGN